MPGRPGHGSRPGTVVERVAMPVRQPTSCTFGGPGLDELFVTSAAEGLPTELAGPQGGLFRLRPGVGGPRTVRFSG